jgi:hypothetical protein
LALAGLGLVGFIPFATALVFLRNSIDGSKLARSHLSRKRQFASVMLAIAIVICLPALIQWNISQIIVQSTDEVLEGTKNLVDNEQRSTRAAAERLRSLFWCSRACFNHIEEEYFSEENSVRKDLLADIYQQITGVNLRWRARFD